MDSSYIIAALAVFTIGGTLTAAIFHFGFHLRDPKNREAVERVAKDRESATTQAADNEGRPLKPLAQRLNEAEDKRSSWTRLPDDRVMPATRPSDSSSTASLALHAVQAS